MRKQGRRRTTERGVTSRPQRDNLSETERVQLLQALKSALADIRRGVTIPKYLLDATREYATDLRDVERRLAARALVCKAADAGASLQRDPPTGKSAFDIVGARMGKSPRWVEAAYRDPLKLSTNKRR